MEMAATAIDTLSTAHRLERDFGMERNAAEGVAIAIHEHMTENLATKVDLERAVDELRGEIKDSEGRLRGEIEAQGVTLRGEIGAQGVTLRGEIEAQGEALRGEIRDVEGRLRGEIEAQGEALRGEMRDVEGRLRGEMKGMEDRMTVGLRSHTDTAVAALRVDMHEEFKTLYRHLWLMLGGFAALIVTLTKLLP